MKKIVFLILILLGFSLQVRAGTNIDSLYDFKRSVRMELNIADNSMIPDSFLIDICQRALLWTSTDCGGIEYTFTVTTVADQAFYAIPDSVVEILYATIVSNKYTKSIKSWPPSFSEEAFGSSLGEEEGEDQTPAAYNWWADSIQLIPVPIQVDTVYLKSFIEHSVVSADGDDVQLKSPYIEAAVAYACHLAYRRLQEYENAAGYLAMYGGIKNEVRAKYTRKFDIMRDQ